MKKGWEWKRLGDLFQIGSSKRVLKSEWTTSGVPFYRGREVTRLAAAGYVENDLFISEEHYRLLSMQHGVPKPGDIVITAIGTIGNAHVVRSSDRFYFKDASVLWMKRTTDVNSVFVNYWLKSTHFLEQLDKGNGATVDTLTIQKLQSIAIPLPPLPEQQRIVGILDEAFAGLATAEANAARNLQNAREIFDSHLHAVFSQRREGWVERRLDEVTADDCSLSYGIVQPGDEVAGGIPLIRPTDMVDGEITLCGLKRIDPRAADGYGRTKIQGGELLVCVRGTTGLVSIASTEVAGGNVTRGIVPVRFRGSWISHDFGFFMLRSDAVQRQIRQKTYGAALQQINISDLRKIMISFPSSDKTQAELAGLLQATREDSGKLLNIYTQKQRTLAELKKSLLSAAFNGDL